MADRPPAAQQWDPAVDPVLCDPFQAPDRHWALDEQGRAKRDSAPLAGRRAPLRITVPHDAKAAPQLSLALGDRAVNKPVMDIRTAVGAWRAGGYPGVTATTLRLLQHWADDEAMRLRPFFAQREAVETFIWLREVATRRTPERRELEAAARAHNDGIVRFCAKMATGTGKTAVMAMVICWQTLNAAHSRRTRNVLHTDRFVVFAPGHTVRRRLAVLVPSAAGNVYDEMGLVPADLCRRLNRARVRVVNYQAFTQRDLIDDANARKLLGRGRGEDVESWPAAVRRVLGDLLGAGARRSAGGSPGRGAGAGPGICVINDEAHHCYIPKVRQKSDSVQKAEDARASVWFNAIRALRDMGVLGADDPQFGQAHPVLDFSATPLWIDTASQSEPEQFEWVSSDFGLMDAIESGLVKVPRVPIDDDTARDETAWRRLYHHTSPKSLKGYLDSPENSGLPAELGGAVTAMVNDWRRKLEAWQPDRLEPAASPHERELESARHQPTPPVLIFVVNTIGNAKALFNFVAGHEDADGRLHRGAFEELSNVDPHGRWHDNPRTLVVHSKIGEDDAVPDELKRLLLRRAGVESGKDAEAAVREMLASVGRDGEPGADVRCVISVAMLTEGWDARTVTNIVGFRAFGTQLLCEQVTGRALRRTSYDALRPPDEAGRRLFEAEYADVVGIPFEFMPAMDNPPEPPQPPKPRTRVHTVAGRRGLRVSWPQVEQYLRVAPQGRFTLRPERVRPWSPPAGGVATMAALEGVAGEESLISALDPAGRRRRAELHLARELTQRVTDRESSAPPAGADEGARGSRDRAAGDPHDIPNATQEAGTSGAGAGGGSGGVDLAAAGRLALFRSALAAVRAWATHPEVRLSTERLLELVIDSGRRSEAVEAVLAACDVSAGPMARRAKLAAHQPLADTDGVDFETTLEHIAEATRSELSHAACHSRLELLTAGALDSHALVARWARNFGLGWTIPYHFEGAWRRYEPDFVAALAAPDGGEVHLIVECKGVMDAKAEAAARWTTEHWIPCVTATAELPDGLRRWHYAFIEHAGSVRHDLDAAVREALAAHAEPSAA